MRDLAIRNTHSTVVSIDNNIDATDEKGNVVTLDEGLITKEIKRLQTEQDALAYQELRAREYPPVADYLDGIAKADDLQVQKYIDDCLAVKLKYPKGND
jgi:hypothetical protein